jgi:hypothetical protein
MSLLNQPSPYHTYVLVRRDIPLADQIVQVGHACLEAGRLFEQSPNGNMVVLSVKSEEMLLKTVAVTEQAGIKWALFYEPDDSMGHTAACSEPIEDGEAKRSFRKFQLWK